MPRPSNSIKVQLWTERLLRFAQSGQTVVQFCRSEGVSQPSFYQWKKKLAAEKLSAETSNPKRSAKVRRISRSTSSIPTGLFQPVQVSSSMLQPSPATVRLPGGIAIELGGDTRIVEAVIAQLLDFNLHSAGGSSC